MRFKKLIALAAALAVASVVVPTVSGHAPWKHHDSELRSPKVHYLSWLYRQARHNAEARCLPIPKWEFTVAGNSAPWKRDDLIHTWKNKLEKIVATQMQCATVPVSSTWLALANCETGVNWQHYNSSYEGAYGFTHAAWDQWRHPSHPYSAAEATPEQQTWVAQAILNDVGWGAWPACSIRLGLR